MGTGVYHRFKSCWIGAFAKAIGIFFSLLPLLPEFIAKSAVLGLSFGCKSYIQDQEHVRACAFLRIWFVGFNFILCNLAVDAVVSALCFLRFCCRLLSLRRSCCHRYYRTWEGEGHENVIGNEGTWLSLPDQNISGCINFFVHQSGGILVSIHINAIYGEQKQV